jgi:hypothetical protein
MKPSIPLLSLFAAVALAACDKPTVVNVPPTASPAPAPVAVPVPVPVPGPAGPQGQPGEPGQPGKPGDGSTVVVVPPPASGPSK